jgi:hypothetical protein
MIIAPNYHSAGNFCNGMAFVKIGNDYYFVDKQGKTK